MLPHNLSEEELLVTPATSRPSSPRIVGDEALGLPPLGQELDFDFDGLHMAGKRSQAALRSELGPASQPTHRSSLYPTPHRTSRPAPQITPSLYGPLVEPPMEGPTVVLRPTVQLPVQLLDSWPGPPNEISHVFFLAGVLTNKQWEVFQREVAGSVARMVAAGPVAAQVTVTRAHVNRRVLGYDTVWTDICVHADARVAYLRIETCLLDVLPLCGIENPQDGLVRRDV
ncbi:hypothetical protein CcaverHIS002_0308410 [Cutaneotrichosporon cavernicola]|uniref:Uncharacterized protein n=1 Tax=Cutaneotrichosporon cavernicola TaxID=279322 RepID=A0AA48L2V4_9TREE|nr:uncharacterized protein CcaverHIS019_0308280 [Cutaneotrichosporon cavernicola]BEI82973.1 hypothetical protein CcaverHIS002_0308410 [Cutaneotrichosporon cavernicola]BEI90758.1 hypothetical protein CcaverHIS019_0308280 [Cutaneotrichosporon cavernicola]BEJ06309.1 hypothetical protein CcaverHIS641_0308310 [Cutaneotrichosporon cavernicola]